MSTQKERIAFVTGGSKGIGKEVVRGLARQGVVVIIGARNIEAGEQAAAELSPEGPCCSIPLMLLTKFRDAKGLNMSNGNLASWTF